MIDILPPIYPNELFYGWISRYRSISGNSHRSTIYNLFSRSNNIKVSIDFPHYLECFCSNISEHFDITPEELIERHTMIPLFKPFVDDNEYQNIISSLINEDYNRMPKRKRYFETKHKTQRFYFCKECFKDGYEKYGEHYINRVHQIPGNQICSKHLIELSEFEVPSNVGYTELVDINNYDLTKNDLYNNDLRFLVYEEQINLSYDINDLFNTNLENQNIELTIDKYDVILQKKGYKIKDGPIDRGKLIKDFNLYYSEKFLKLMNSFVEGNDRGWIDFIGAQKRRDIDPLRHLLFIRFLFGSFYNFITFNHFEEQSSIDNKLKYILLNLYIEFMLNNFKGNLRLIIKNAYRLKILDDCYYNIKKEKYSGETTQKTKKEVSDYVLKSKCKNTDSLRGYLRHKLNLDFYILEIIEKEWLDNIITECINKNYIVQSIKGNKVANTINKIVN